MALTILKFKIDPDQIPEEMKGKIFELNDPDGYDDINGLPLPRYVGWVEFREDGTIEFGEPGE